MKITISVDSKALEAALKKAPGELSKRLEAAFVDIGELLTIEARAMHRWKHRKHNLEQDIGYKKLLGVKHGISFGLKENFHMTKTRTGRSYGEYLHDGFKSWSPDPWIHNAVTKKEPEITKEINDAVAKVAEGI